MNNRYIDKLCKIIKIHNDEKLIFAELCAFYCKEAQMQHRTPIASQNTYRHDYVSVAQEYSQPSSSSEKSIIAWK